MLQKNINYSENSLLTKTENHFTDTTNLFESYIVDRLNEINCNKSSCFFCHSETSFKIPIDKRNIVELESNGLFNNNYCYIPSQINEKVFPGDFIIVKNEEYYEIAQVKHIGEIVRLKRQAQGLFDETISEFVRKASTEDLERVKKNILDENRAVPYFKQAINKFNLNMKLVNIHYQYDRKKLFFFYTSDGRVDFRELAKDLASEFKTRIELRQIGVRDEAKKMGGMGTCGREYCCVAFLISFKKITTQLANEQNLLSSMGKLSGPCGKLKCCLSFEVD